MDFGYDARTEELRGRLLAFMDSHVYPAESAFANQVAEAESAGQIWQRPAVIDELKAEARRQGLWNLFLTVRKHKDQIGEIAEKHGAGLTNLQYAPLAEITGRSGAARTRGAELRGAGHREHGGARRVRQRRAGRAVAAAAAGRRRSGRRSA